ncbi:putative ephrin-receptor like protein [Giardia muris]|uniref:Putative ephrin-receptor like protein n=1 Tax=Giardia muris TaxID=5742 RepID=A0A4Z1SZJ9_GIAMU|nr:putative ephrin-receptor like protein [Giardia muris]|eukprot:TNJ30175.1 putative ephrin-receptor like protein [Giardia muris]
MLVFTLLVYLLAGVAVLGTVGGWYDVQETYGTEEFLGRRLLFRSLEVSWTKDEAVLGNVRNELSNILNVNAIPVINWNPLLPNTYSDSLQAIMEGLHDDLIEAFFQLLEDILIENKKYAILFFGTTCNSPNVYWSESPEAYINVYKRLHILAKERGLNEYIFWGWSLDITHFYPMEGSDTSLNLTGLVHPPSAYFPGESYVSWIGLQLLTQDESTRRNPDEPIRIAMSLASSLAPGKPVMLIGGTASFDNLHYKTDWFVEFFETAILHTDRQSYSATVVKAVLLYNLESSLDTGFYGSTNGDVIVSTTNNGVDLYSYLILPELLLEQEVIIPMTGESPEIQEVGSIVASGAICGPGEYGLSSAAICAPCPAGTFNDQLGMAECLPCEIGTYNEEVGQLSCLSCPSNTSTVDEGTRLAIYCECAPGYKYRDGMNKEKGCEQCPKNTYSHFAALSCIDCPSGYRWPPGKSGVGCYCRKGQWDHTAANCANSVSSGILRSNGIGILMTFLAILGVFLIK